MALLALLGCVPSRVTEDDEPPERLGDIRQAWGQTALPEVEGRVRIAVGETQQFALPPGTGISLQFGGIALEGGADGIHLALQPVGGEVEETIHRPLAPTESARLELLQAEPGFAWLRLDATGQAPGAVWLESPVLSRSGAEDRLGECGVWSGNGAERPNLFIFMVDTLRADRLSIYGHDRPTTPTLDKFAESATVFDNGIAQSPWTRPSVASMFTGLTPAGHGVNGRDDALPWEAETLAELLQEAGYQTTAVFTNGNASDSYNFHQGFDLYRRTGGPGESGTRALNEVAELLAARDEDRPLFMYIHINEPHAPYSPPERFRSRWAAGVDPAAGSLETLQPLRNATGVDSTFKNAVLSLYDGDIAFMDHLFGRFQSYLDAQALLDNSAILFVSDHGEQFWETDVWGHGLTLAETLIRIPFILRIPGQTCGLRSPRIAQHIDIMPTFLALAGIEGRYQGEGVSLLQPSLPVDRFAYSALDKRQCTGVAMSTRDWKLVVSRSSIFTKNSTALYLLDRATEEVEESNLIDRYPRVVDLLEASIQQHEGAEAQLAPALTPLDDELRRELEALGYLDPESGP